MTCRAAISVAEPVEAPYMASPTPRSFDKLRNRGQAQEPWTSSGAVDKLRSRGQAQEPWTSTVWQPDDGALSLSKGPVIALQT